MTKTLEPVKLWVPDYYKKSPEVLFNEELAFSEQNHKIARFIGEKIFDNKQVYANPEALKVLSDGACVVVSNHLDFSDPVFLGLIFHDLGLPHPEFTAMAELFDADHPHIAQFVASLGGFPLDRARLLGAERDAIYHFNATTEYVLGHNDQPLVIYPEGGIHPKPIRYPNRVDEVGKMALKVAKRNKVPLVVVGVAGTRMSLLRSMVPGATVVGAVSANKVYGHDELPSPIQLRMAMQTNANIARSLVREHLKY